MDLWIHARNDQPGRIRKQYNLEHKDPKYVKAEYQPRFPAQADKKGIASSSTYFSQYLKPKRIKGYLEYKFRQRKKKPSLSPAVMF
ncbi:hypothetical protein GQ457_17G007620 [Hibiscus cannabinus]